MKFSSFLLLAAVCAAGVAGAAHIRTVQGKMYRDVEFRKVSEKGLIFMHSNGMVTLRPDQLNHIDKRRYSIYIDEYRSFTLKKRSKVQAELDYKINALKSRPVAQRLFGYAALKKFYSTDQFEWAELNFDRLKELVKADHKKFENEMNSMDIGVAIYYAQSFKELYGKLGLLADEFTATFDILSATAIEQFPEQMGELKTMKTAQRLKRAQVLLRGYGNLPVELDALRRMIADDKAELDISRGINKFAKSRNHSGAIGELSELIARYPKHRMRQSAEKLKEYHVMCLDTKDNFDFIISYYSKNQSVAFRVMAKALKIYTDSPYAANAKKTYDVWQKKKKEE